MSFVKIDKDFKPDTNFWELNSQMIIIPPFSKLYSRDKTENKAYSSKEMWTLFFMCDPDEDENLMFRMTTDDRKEAISEAYFPDLDWTDKLFMECMESYPFSCLTSIERSLKDTKEYLMQRATLLKELTKDKKTYLKDMAKIESAISKNGKIYEDFSKIEQEFSKSKASTIVKGGRNETKQERGLI